MGWSSWLVVGAVAVGEDRWAFRISTRALTTRPLEPLRGSDVAILTVEDVTKTYATVRAVAASRSPSIPARCSLSWAERGRQDQPRPHVARHPPARRRPHRLPPARRQDRLARPARLGYLPEDRGLYRDVPVLRTLVYFGILRGMAKARRPQGRPALARPHGPRRAGRTRTRHLLEGQPAEGAVRLGRAAPPRVRRPRRAVQWPRPAQPGLLRQAHPRAGRVRHHRPPERPPDAPRRKARRSHPADEQGQRGAVRHGGRDAGQDAGGDAARPARPRRAGPGGAGEPPGRHRRRGERRRPHRLAPATGPSSAICSSRRGRGTTCWRCNRSA